MKKFLLLGFLMLLLAVVPPAMAKGREEETDTSGDVPEVNGDYPDPKNKDVRVRVFVHGQKDKERDAHRSTTILSCTNPDAVTMVSAAGWHLSGSTTYRLNVSSVPSSIGSGNLPTIVNNSFSAWAASVPGKVSFSRGPDTTVARSTLDWQNIVAWGRTNGNALGVTYIRYYTATGLVADVDTIINQKFQWRWTDPSTNACSLYADAYDAQDILTHEIGHWMGLNDEYSTIFADHTMYGYGAKGELKKNTLTTGDVLGALAIYP